MNIHVVQKSITCNLFRSKTEVVNKPSCNFEVFPNNTKTFQNQLFSPGKFTQISLLLRLQMLTYFRSECRIQTSKAMKLPGTGILRNSTLKILLAQLN